MGKQDEFGDEGAVGPAHGSCVLVIEQDDVQHNRVVVGVFVVAVHAPVARGAVNLDRPAPVERPDAHVRLQKVRPAIRVEPPRMDNRYRLAGRGRQACGVKALRLPDGLHDRLGHVLDAGIGLGRGLDGRAVGVKAVEQGTR